MNWNAEWDRNPTDWFEISEEKACFENSLENHCDTPIKRELEAYREKLLKQLKFNTTRL